jgi:fructan beta-fructosidase
MTRWATLLLVFTASPLAAEPNDNAPDKAKDETQALSRDLTIDKRYLHLPVKNGAPKRRVTFSVGKQVVREFDIELAEGAPDFWVFADVSAFKKATLTLSTTLPSGSRALDALKLADDVPDAEKIYKEKRRPLFHFTSRVGWLNDPNGLVYVPDKELGHLGKGEWHLFYQHNPYGREWGNMHWGHAVSPDLFRWKEQPIALYPKKYGDWAFSGSAVVDHSKSTKEKPFLTLAYTSTGRGECIAFSDNNGRTWKEYEGNPVVKHAGRDPKLVWYEKGKHWVMAVYDEFQKKQWIAFYTSPDLRKWTFASRIEGFYECPDLFELPVQGVLGVVKGSKWVLYAADGKYLVGDFDGKTFKPDFKEKRQLWHGNFYAAQTFANPPNTWIGGPMALPIGPPRRVQIGWARGITFPGMPFNQQMTVPSELQLIDYSEMPGEPKGARLAAAPAGEITTLRDGKNLLTPQPVKEAATLAENLDAFDAELILQLQDSKGFTLDLRGTKLVYDAAKETLTCKGVTVPLKSPAYGIQLRILVDRGSVEVFTDAGRVAMSVAAIPDEKKQALELMPNGGTLVVRGGVWRMKSAWEK